MDQGQSSNPKQANPTAKHLRSFFKHQMSCPFYSRVMRYHRAFFRYAEYDLDKEQSRLSEIEELKA